LEGAAACGARPAHPRPCAGRGRRRRETGRRRRAALRSGSGLWILRRGCACGWRGRMARRAVGEVPRPGRLLTRVGQEVLRSRYRLLCSAGEGALAPDLECGDRVPEVVLAAGQMTRESLLQVAEALPMMDMSPAAPETFGISGMAFFPKICAD
jgi:hypothetical protein